MVLSDSGILSEYQGVTGPPPLGRNHRPHGPWERRGDNPQGGSAPPPKASPNRKGGGTTRLSLFLSSPSLFPPQLEEKSGGWGHGIIGPELK